MSTLKPLFNKFIFSFLDTVENKAFKNKTDWGLEIRNPVEDVKESRWAKVISAGSDITEFKADDYVLIQPLMWTHGLEFDGTDCWSSDLTKVLMYTSKVPTGYR